METNKSPYLKSASWRASGVVPASPKAWETRSAHCTVPAWKPAGLRLRKSHHFNSSSKAGKTNVPAWRHSGKRGSLLLGETSPFSSMQAFNRLGKACWCQGGKSALLSLPIQMSISPRTALTDTHRIILNKMSEHPVAQSSWHIKLIHIHITHHIHQIFFNSAYRY